MKKWSMWCIIIAPLPVIFFSLFLGPSSDLTISKLWHWLLWETGFFDSSTDEMLLPRAIILNIRLPRILLAFMAGAALSGSGMAMQAVFRNPLVSPYILGLSAGAACGAALALAYNIPAVQILAFVFGLSAVLISYLIARTGGTVPVVSLILSGVIVTGIFTAMLTIIQFLTDPFKLQTIVHWTMGNLHTASWEKVNSMSIPFILGTGWLLWYRWRLNVLALGDEEARAVGIHPDRTKLLVLLPATLIASSAVAVAGVIGLVGLAFPHMVRMMVGPDNKLALPLSFLFGGTLLLLIDDCSRSLTSFELPIGIFTIFIGGPFFIFLLKRSRIGWEV